MLDWLPEIEWQLFFSGHWVTERDITDKRLSDMSRVYAASEPVAMTRASEMTSRTRLCWCKTRDVMR